MCKQEQKYAEWIEEFSEIVERERDKTKHLTTADVINTIAQNGWFPYFAMKRAVIKDYYKNQRKLGWGVRQSILDTCVAYGVNESYVKDLIYKHTDVV